ncbi:MAG TPA: hypothetical protein VGL71_14540, partial [Urbifossiella sp.]
RQLCSERHCKRPSLLIALTGDGADRDRQKSFEAGFNHHLLKPAPIDSILDLLKMESVKFVPAKENEFA